VEARRGWKNHPVKILSLSILAEMLLDALESAETRDVQLLEDPRCAGRESYGFHPVPLKQGNDLKRSVC
jgi:hypothetical protein